MVATADYFTEALGQKITIDNLIQKDDPPRPVAVKPNCPHTDSKWLLVGETESMTDEDFIAAPILGDIIRYQQVHKDRIGRGKFFLRAKSDSMEAPIVDGDLLLIEPGPQWTDKIVVVVYIDGEVTCKRLHLYDHSAALVSDNTKYPQS